MENNYHRYIYDGAIMVFDKCVESNWKAETMAPSEKKAKSNLTYQAKRYLNAIAGAKVTLPGKIKMVD